jgi:hypothetical protein
MSLFHELAHQEWLIVANFAAEKRRYKVGCGLGGRRFTTQFIYWRLHAAVSAP